MTVGDDEQGSPQNDLDRKSTRLNSSHLVISYAVFCLKKPGESPLNRPSTLLHRVLCACTFRTRSSRKLSSCFFKDTATTEIDTLSLHDARPICGRDRMGTRLQITCQCLQDRNESKVVS